MCAHAFLLCMCLCVCGSENKFMKLVISFNLSVGSSDQTQVDKPVLQVVFPGEPSL